MIERKVDIDIIVTNITIFFRLKYDLVSNVHFTMRFRSFFQYREDKEREKRE